MWQGIYGHDTVVERFRRSLASGRLASSYLFLGPSGIGKRAFALKLAKALLCTNSSESDLNPCDRCDSCRLLDAGTHPDVDIVGFLPGKRILSIDQFLGAGDNRHREGLCHNIGMRPMMGRRRVAIIDDADHLNPESANCLLKTLEEPPLGAVLILIGTNRSRQLPTILSRSQVVQFEPLKEDFACQVLLDQGLVQDPKEAQELVRESGGSLQRASEILALNLREFRPRLLSQLSAQPIDGNRLTAAVGEFVNEAGTEADAKRQRMRAAFDIVTQHLRQQLLRGSSTNRASESRLLAALDRCLSAEDELDRNANQATLLECWIDDLTRLLNPNPSTH
jgi:DNA polymerase-3 subunit delta'